MPNLSDLDVGKEAINGTIAQFATVGVGFVGTVVFARVLGPTNFGGVMLFLAIVGMLGNPMDGFAVAVHKEVSESTSVLDESLGAQLLFNFIWIAAVSVPILLASGIFADETYIKHASLLAIFYLATNSVLETLYSPLQGLGRIGFSYWVDTAKRLVGVTLRILGVLAFGAVGMIYGSITVAVLFLPIILWVIGTIPRRPSERVFRRHAEYGKFSIPSRFLSSLAKRFDLLLLGTLATTAAVSWYEVAWQLAIPGFYLVQSLGASLMTKVSAMGRNADGLEAEINGALTYAGILAVPLFFGSIALGGDVLELLFGSEYVDAFPFLIGLTGYQVVRSQSEPLELAAKGLNYPDVVFSIRVATVVTNTVLGVAFLFAIGPIGVLFATIVAGVLRFWLLFRHMRQEVGVDVQLQSQFAEQVVAGMAVYLSVTLAERVFDSGSNVETVLLLLVGAITYFGSLALVGSSHREFIRRLYSEYSSS